MNKITIADLSEELLDVINGQRALSTNWPNVQD